jgi:hypothetical protein
MLPQVPRAATCLSLETGNSPQKHREESTTKENEDEQNTKGVQDGVILDPLLALFLLQIQGVTVCYRG